MSIRRPSVFRVNDIIFQDSLYFDADNGEQLRCVLAKFDNYRFSRSSETFDYPSPDRKGGHVIARIDYTLGGQVVTIDHWEINWRDDWPLRLAAQFLVHCLYPSSQGFIVKVDKDSEAFWVSEYFIPLSNDPSDYLIFHDGHS